MRKAAIGSMAVNSIVPMMTPAHLRAPQKSPVTLQLIKEATKPTPVTVPLLKPRNGVGHFVLPLQRILFTYCSHCGDSTSTREFLKKEFVKLAEANPSVEFVVEARWNKRPTIYAEYLGGMKKAVSVHKKSIPEIMEVYEGLRDESGEKARPFHQAVKSDTPAIRPIWSPFHNRLEGEADELGKYRSA